MRLLKTEQDIIQLLKEDTCMMNILLHVQSLHLPDWWVCAGFVRSKIWDTLHGFSTRTPLPDVDVIYFDAINLDENFEKQLEQLLLKMNPYIPWSVKNEARMHLINNFPPYNSSIDAMSKFPETATALGLTLDQHNKLILAAPHGIDDVINLKVKPTPYYTETELRLSIYKRRITQKNWTHTWGKVEESFIRSR